MQNKIRVGIIGCGSIAKTKHMPAIAAAIPEAEMVAFCNTSIEKALAARDTFGTPDAKVYTDYNELLQDSSIDVVHVCTANRTHSIITITALESGKHVMCEKPMALNAVEAKAMLDTSKKTGKKLTIAYPTRCRKDTRYLKKLIEADAFGEIYVVKGHAIRRRGAPTWGAFLDKAESGGGPLIDIGTHSLDLILWLINNYKPKSVTGSAYQKLINQPIETNLWGAWDPKKFTVEDSAFGFIKMENGATILLESSFVLNIADELIPTCVLCGTKQGAHILNGELYINGERNAEAYIETPDLNVDPHVADDIEPFHMEQRLWYDAIIHDTEPFVLPEQALVVTQILDAIYHSAETGKTVYFN